MVKIGWVCSPKAIAGLAAVLASCASGQTAPAEQRTSPQSQIAASPGAEGVADMPLPPSELYPGLFPAVALAKLYEPKDWVDAVPLADPDDIMGAWRDAAANGGAPTDGALAAFVEAHFALPRAAAAESVSKGLTLTEHIDALWPILTKEAADDTVGSLLPLPYPYLIPGGRFREVYYWDAYFTLAGMGEGYAEVKADMVRNFRFEIERYGRVPNANRTYYLSRSQPPFFHMMVALTDPDDPAAAYAENLDALLKEHAFWVAGEGRAMLGSPSRRSVRMPGGASLARYYDDRDVPRDESYVYDVETAAKIDRPVQETYRDLRAGAESGWDYSSRWFADGETLATIETTNIVPADLNAILYGLERAIAAGCMRAARMCAATFAQRASDRQAAMTNALWYEEGGYFADWHREKQAPTGRPSAAMLYPLFFGVATQEQADRTADAVRQYLLAPGGILATPTETGEQWDAPNGWAPLQWIAVLGLERYGHRNLAEDIAERWTRTVARGFCESGKLVEKYDVVKSAAGGGGEYPTQDGFGWTNGVTAAFLARSGDPFELGLTRTADDAADCARLTAPLPAR